MSWEKGPSAICQQCWPISACAFVQSDQGLHFCWMIVQVTFCFRLNSVDPAQTVRRSRLIWVYAVCTWPKVLLSYTAASIHLPVCNRLSTEHKANHPCYSRHNQIYEQLLYSHLNSELPAWSVMQLLFKWTNQGAQNLNASVSIVHKPGAWSSTQNDDHVSRNAFLDMIRLETESANSMSFIYMYNKQASAWEVTLIPTESTQISVCIHSVWSGSAPVTERL